MCIHITCTEIITFAYRYTYALHEGILVLQGLQDRIDELQSELQEFHNLGRVPQLCSKPLSEELESKSPGMESDPGKTHCDKHVLV